MADEQSIQLAIEARDRAKEIVGSATRDLDRYRTALKLAKEEGDRTNEGNRRMGEIMAQVNAARQRQVDGLKQHTGATTQLTEAQLKLRQAVTQAAEGLAGQAGMAGRLAAGFGGVALAGAAVAGTLVAITAAMLSASKSIGDFQEKQDILGETLDMTQREIGALTLGAANIGRSFESIQPALFIFTRRLGEARAGSDEARRTFRALGIDPQKDLRATGEILRSVGQELDGVGDKAVRNKLLVELFGRGGSAVLPILRQDFEALAETAERTGITLSESAQETAREADQAWDRLRASVSGLRNSIMVSLAPAGTFLVELFGKIAQSAAEAAASTDNLDFDQLKEQLKDVGARADEAWKKIKRALGGGGGSFSETEIGVFGPTDTAQGANQPTVARGMVMGPSLFGVPDATVAKMQAESEAFWAKITEKASQFSDEQQKQLESARKAVELLDLRHSLGVLTLDAEIKALQAMRAQVQTRKELEVIEAKIAKLRLEQAKGLADPARLAQVREIAGQPVESDARSVTGQWRTFRQVQEEAARREARNSGQPEPDGWRRTEGSAETKEREDPADLQKRMVEIQKEHQESVVRTIRAVDQGAQALRDFAHNLAEEGRSVISSLGQFAAQVLDIIGQITGNSKLGPIGGLVSTLTSFLQGGGRVMPRGMQSGGVVAGIQAFQRPLYAQSGLVLSGSRGVDSVPAMLGRGEMVVSHTETENIQAILGRVDRALSRAPQPVASSPSVNFSPGAIQITVRGNSRMDWRREVNDGLMPEIVRAIRLGTANR